MPLPSDYPEVLCDIADCIQQALGRALPANQSEVLSMAAADAMRRRFGGSLIYIPKGDSFLRARRDAAIMREFTGNNHRDLARRHKLTVSKVYEVLARCRKAGTALSI